MGRIPFPLFNRRIREAFDEGARARPCDSSGSEHSAELSDLVNSFIEKDDRVKGLGDLGDEINDSDSEKENFESDRIDKLKNLFEDEDEDEEKAAIRRETEKAYRVMGLSHDDEGFKRQLMSRLRMNGLDAGICKSQWKKIGQFPAGDYAYIDVTTTKTRYIVDVSLVKEFTIARPTQHYQSLLDLFPQVFVGRPDEVKQIVRLMCAGVRESMKSNDMFVPPWRKNRYMSAKWLGSYKRTTSSVSSRLPAVCSGEVLDGKRSIGFERSVEKFSYCKGEVVGRNVNFRVGNLAQVLNGLLI